MLVAFSEQMEARRAELKRVPLRQRLYRHYRVVRMAEKARRVVTELFKAYVAMPDQLPRWVQERADGGAAAAGHLRLSGRHDRPLCH